MFRIPQAKVLIAIGFAFCLFTNQVQAGPIFSENFEGNLSQWPANAQGQIVNDPVVANNHALNFTGRNAGGDIFSTLFTLTPGTDYVLSFDYLGTSQDANGFIGLYWNNNLSENWLGGVSPYPGIITLINDEQWHHYTIHFSTQDTSGATSVGLKLEDYNGFGSSIGKAYFDNISVDSAVPEPTSMTLLGMGVFGLVGCRWRRLRGKRI